MLVNVAHAKWKTGRPMTAQSGSTVSLSAHQVNDSDSGYSSRPSTSTRYSKRSDRSYTENSIYSAAETVQSEVVSPRVLQRPQSHPSRLDQSPPTRPSSRGSRGKTRSTKYEPKAFARWKAHMNGVAAKVDCRWVTPSEDGSYESADMMKYKATSRDFSDTENKTVKEESGGDNPKSTKKEQTRTKPLRRAASAGKSLRGGRAVEIHYEKMLPVTQWVECKPKKYVTNYRYGNHYEARPATSSKHRYAPTPGMKFLWENNCQVWLMERLNSVDFNTQRSRGVNDLMADGPHSVQQGTSNKEMTPTRNTKAYKRPKTAPVTSRELATEQRSWKSQLADCPATDKANVFDKFVEWSMANQKRKYAAIVIQKYAKRWLVRMKIRRLRERSMMKHGCSWESLCIDYKAILSRIQRRCGEPKPSCPLTYTDIEQYMSKKEKYEAVFDEMADIKEMLPRNQIMPLFRKCGLFPLESEVKSAFRAVFKGCSVQADVVFLLDCSTSIGSAVYEMQLGLIKDIIGHCDVTYDKIHVAVIPYNDDVFRVIDFDSYGSKEELLAELAELTYTTVKAYGQITRTDLALKCMTELIQKATSVNDHIRDGSQVPKLCFAFTDGKCYHTQLTARWAKFAREKLKVKMYAVTCTDESTTKPYLLNIASAEDRVLRLPEYKTLTSIKAAIQGQMCLKSCPLCHYAQKSTKDGVLCSDERRGLFKHEVLELIWMVYCPPATGLKKYKDSLWMTPQVEGKDSMKLSRYHPVGADYRNCLRTAVEERIAKTGKVILPTETGVRVREITDVDLAMDFIDQLCVSKLTALGLVEKVGLNVRVPAKYH